MSEAVKEIRRLRKATLNLQRDIKSLPAHCDNSPERPQVEVLSNYCYNTLGQIESMMFDLEMVFRRCEQRK